MKKYGIISALIFEIAYLIFWLTIGLLFTSCVTIFAFDYTQDIDLLFDFCITMFILFVLPLLTIINSLIGTIRLFKNKKVTWLNKICFFLQFGIIIFWIVISHR